MQIVTGRKEKMSRISVIICLLAALQLSTPSVARRSCNHGKKRCERLVRFLQDVLDARDDLTWIDRMAARMRAKESHSNSGLQEKINAMFLISEEPGQSLLEPMRERERSKRQSNRTVKFIQPTIVVDAQQENDTTTEDPLEKLLRSINVFPVEDAIAKVNKTESSRIGRSLKAISLGTPGTRSHASKAIYGDLAKEIVEEVLNQVKNKEKAENNADNVLRPKPLTSFVADSLDQGEPTLENEKDSFAITQKLIHLCKQLISEEVEKKSCVALPPDLREFLVFLLSPEDNRPMNKVKVKKSAEYDSSLSEWYRKNQILNNLLDEYDILTKKDKSRVRGIYEYLVSRHDFVESSIEAFESRSMPVPA